jgi:hypothetical protein
VEFIRGGAIVPVYRGIRLLGNWKRTREKLAEVGIHTPETDRNDEQSFDIVNGLGAWIRFDHVSVESVNAELIDASPLYPDS